jgi:hypothetical protein
MPTSPKLGFHLAQLLTSDNEETVKLAGLMGRMGASPHIVAEALEARRREIAGLDLRQDLCPAQGSRAPSFPTYSNICLY